MGTESTNPKENWWSARELSVFRLAATFAGVGMLTLVLPVFGLQYRKFAQLGDKAYIGGIMLIVLGGLVAGITAVRHYGRSRLGVAIPRVPRRVWLGALAVGGALVLLFAVLGVASLALKRKHGPPTTGAPPGQALVPAPVAGSAGPSDPVSRFGAEKTVRLILIGTDGLDVMATLRAKMPALTDPGGNRSWKSTHEAGRLVVAVGPVSDLEAVARRIDFGTVTEVDRDGRALTIAVDRTRLAEKKRQPG